MPIERNKVLAKNRPSREDVRDKLAQDWGRCFPPSSKGTAADGMGCSTGTVDNGITGKHLPELHTVLASLLVDPTALQDTLALYGVKVVPLVAQAANDLSTISGLSHLAGRWVDALSDKVRDHRETCQLADHIRPLLISLSAIVAEADRLKSE